jgi:hypothetical protein
MNQYHEKNYGSGIMNGPFFAKEVNRFLSLMETPPKEGLSVLVICEFLGLANNDPERAYKMYAYMLLNLQYYFNAAGIAIPRWVQYEEKMIDYCNFAWNRFIILSKGNMRDDEGRMMEPFSKHFLAAQEARSGPVP